jgi:hypothetical protein
MTTIESVVSRFSVVSPRHGVEPLSALLPWKVVESDQPHDRVEFFVTVFDLGVGRHGRFDRHLERATEELFKERNAIEAISAECRFALWVRLRSPGSEAVADLPDHLVSRLAYLRIGLQLQIRTQGGEASARRPSRRRRITS